MDKLLKLLSLDSLKGSRTKLSLIVAGVLGILVQFGLISPDLQQTIIEIGIPFGLFFAVEHFDKK